MEKVINIDLRVYSKNELPRNKSENFSQDVFIISENGEIGSGYFDYMHNEWFGEATKQGDFYWFYTPGPLKILINYH